jgi:DNA-binding Xre family transcriptional regulator
MRLGVTVSEQLRKAIVDSGETHYRIGKQTGIDTRVLDRFVSGERPTLRSDTVDKLCEYLGLELRPKKKPKR